MPTKLSLLGTHGIDSDAAREYGDRLPSLTLWDKTHLLETISGWLSQCAVNDPEDWDSLDTYADGYSELGEKVLDMLRKHFDYCEPEASLGLMLALVYQVKEECYAPPTEGDDDEFDLSELLEAEA
jgi:hypothetical protein